MATDDCGGGEVAGLVYDPEAHSYVFKGKPVPGVTKVMRHAGLLSVPDFIPFDTSEAKARGRAVHKACELDDLGTLGWDEPGSLLHDYLAAYRDFKSDTGFVPRLVETLFCAEAWGFAGRLDREGILFGRPAVVDIKTCAEPHPPSRVVGIQLAGYELALPWCRDANGNSVPDPVMPRARFAVSLWPGGYKVTEFKDRADRTVFLAALTLYRFRTEQLREAA